MFLYLLCLPAFLHRKDDVPQFILDKYRLCKVPEENTPFI